MSIWEFKVRVFVFSNFVILKNFPKKRGEPVKFKLEKKFKNFHQNLFLAIKTSNIFLSVFGIAFTNCKRLAGCFENWNDYKHRCSIF
jgi:hypothetical protein